ncbi:hypothetical protein T05_11020 [Trichinella murrelli]|uniref:Uncharacterized protein n=1 Tax=Trichinella murrelli TaxID=144512 RepID=A0A0V0T8S1_9BILA|nr:hypothetical protein T05_11020 [Trichinella murrelli]
MFAISQNSFMPDFICLSFPHSTSPNRIFSNVPIYLPHLTNERN